MSITYEQIQTVVLVILAACGAVATIGKAVDVIRGWLKPGSERHKDVHTKLATDKARLDAHEKEINELRDGQRVICSGVQALLDHALHNGNAQQMQDASNKLTEWLINK